eukprot:scaffold6454_cov113-Isochrysis_galbana.AAC.10
MASSIGSVPARLQRPALPARARVAHACRASAIRHPPPHSCHLRPACLWRHAAQTEQTRTGPRALCTRTWHALAKGNVRTPPCPSAEHRRPGPDLYSLQPPIASLPPTHPNPRRPWVILRAGPSPVAAPSYRPQARDPTFWRWPATEAAQPASSPAGCAAPCSAARRPRPPGPPYWGAAPAAASAAVPTERAAASARSVAAAGATTGATLPVTRQRAAAGASSLASPASVEARQPSGISGEAALWLALNARARRAAPPRPRVGRSGSVRPPLAAPPRPPRCSVSRASPRRSRRRRATDQAQPPQTGLPPRHPHQPPPRRPPPPPPHPPRRPRRRLRRPVSSRAAPGCS